MAMNIYENGLMMRGYIPVNRINPKTQIRLKVAAIGKVVKKSATEKNKKCRQGKFD